MFGMRWRLFRLMGIPVSVDISGCSSSPCSP